MEVEYKISIPVFSWHGIGPQFAHKEHLVGELRTDAFSYRSRLPDPISQMADKVEEKVTFWHGYYLVSYES